MTVALLLLGSVAIISDFEVQKLESALQGIGEGHGKIQRNTAAEPTVRPNIHPMLISPCFGSGENKGELTWSELDPVPHVAL